MKKEKRKKGKFHLKRKSIPLKAEVHNPPSKGTDIAFTGTGGHARDVQVGPTHFKFEPDNGSKP